MSRQLTITPAPFKSSYLAIPPTPFSPRLPITPPASPPKHNDLADRAAKLKASAQLLPPPSEPLHWLWQCHKCNRVYQLGVTRRCLDDGHFFCAGTTVVKRSKRNGYKKVLRHQACASEFDYQGWKSWGTWRRTVAEQAEAAEALLRAEEIMDGAPGSESRWFSGNWSKASPTKNFFRKKEELRLKKNCWEKCDYPSECRWGKQYGVKTPTLPTTTTTVVPSSPPQTLPTAEKPLQAKTSFEEILGLANHSPSTDPTSVVITTLDITDALTEDLNYLEPLSPTKSSSQRAVTDGETKITTMDDLLESAKRRKRRSSGPPPSPLGANPPSPEEEMSKGMGAGVVGGGSPLVRSPSAEPTRTDSAGAVAGKGGNDDIDARLQRAFDDFEVDIRKGLGSLAPLQEKPAKAEGFVRGLIVSKKQR